MKWLGDYRMLDRILHTNLQLKICIVKPYCEEIRYLGLGSWGNNHSFYFQIISFNNEFHIVAETQYGRGFIVKVTDYFGDIIISKLLSFRSFKNLIVRLADKH